MEDSSLQVGLTMTNEPKIRGIFVVDCIPYPYPCQICEKEIGKREKHYLFEMDFGADDVRRIPYCTGCEETWQKSRVRKIQ